MRLVVGAAIAALASALGLWAPPAGAAWPGVNGKIVFFKFGVTPPATFSGQIFSVNRNGTGDKNLSAAGGGVGQLDIQPSVSPNGRFIAFVRFDALTGSAQLWVMRSNGTGQTDISNDAAFASESGPAWTPDSSRLLFVRQPPGSFPGAAFTGSAGGAIAIRNADGTGIADTLTTGPNDSNPAMSPSGHLIAFSRPVGGVRHLFVMNANATGQIDLGVQGSKPDWSPDGTRLVYGQAGSGSIMMVNLSDPSRQELLRSGANEAPVWSPDGSQIAFVDCSETGVIGDNCQIAVMSATGENAHDITSEPTLSDQKPDWQAHGNQGFAP